MKWEEANGLRKVCRHFLRQRNGSRRAIRHRRRDYDWKMCIRDRLRGETDEYETDITDKKELQIRDAMGDILKQLPDVYKRQFLYSRLLP